MTSAYDVIVVGAGPAGASAAWALARAGASVALVDPSHPREKPCGGGVTGRALALVADAIDPAGLTAAVIETARFADARAGSAAIVPLEAHGIAPASALVVASRADFDGRLLDAARRAGATLVETRVSEVAVDRTAVRVETPHGILRAGFLIGADGANSLVRRRLACPFRRDQLSIATGFFAHGVTSREVVIEIVPDPPGYIWSFPRPNHLAIGICTQADTGVGSRQLRQRAADWIRSTRIAGGASLAAYSWPIPSLHAADFDRLPTAGSRWCLAGDAAGLVDPITREGIFFAIQSGRFAAAAVQGPNAAREYAARIADEIATELRCAAALKDGFFHPRFTGLLLRALRHSGAVRRVMADLVAGRQPYATLKWRLIRTLELRLAWAWMRSGAPWA
ncbi:MAG: geranylgeranyl reductase family protein [Acidobacteria bacterium]|nr:geranylgeranyl reductase family protein [Acidobacteriota bacterium]